jgi:hypothetical protein
VGAFRRLPRPPYRRRTSGIGGQEPEGFCGRWTTEGQLRSHRRVVGWLGDSSALLLRLPANGFAVVSRRVLDVRSASSVGTPQDPGRSQPPWPAPGRTTRRRVRAGPSEGIAWGRRGRTGRAVRASSAPSPHTRTWSRNPVTLSRFRVPRKAGAARRSPAVPLPRLHRDGSATARAVRERSRRPLPPLPVDTCISLSAGHITPVKRSPRPSAIDGGFVASVVRCLATLTAWSPVCSGSDDAEHGREIE